MNDGIKFLLLMLMIFCHIVDDYYLQGWLVSAKQQDWWKKNCPEDMYKHDYIVALLMHSFSWTFMVMLPSVVYTILFGGTIYPLLYLFNFLLHAFINNMKANWKEINLVQDQVAHLAQIVLTWMLIIWR